MAGKKAFLITQSLLCALVAGLLASGALRLYAEGAAKQAEGDLFFYMFTRERVWEKLLPVLPFFLVALGLTAAGLVLGIRDEHADQPVRDEKFLRDLGNLRNRAAPQAPSRNVRILRTAMIVLAAALIIAGILNGGLADMLAKGSAVCTECIGLG